jgi:SAM-dependent methyltransferase
MPVTRRDARDDWRRFAAPQIPTKSATPLLDAFLAEGLEAADVTRPPQLLDVGCGDGRLALRMSHLGYAVTGIDVNERAVAAAAELAAAQAATVHRPRFLVADAAGSQPPSGLGEPFDVVVCQLVVSIVGGHEDRDRLLKICAALLRPGGRMFLSASGVSGDVNPEYARLYAQDEPLTGEAQTYYSRDEAGRVLYATHHFSEPELRDLLAAAGFTSIGITPLQEASSRRPEERAIFLYATAAKPPAGPGGDPQGS